ncbi:hypothetical protein RUM44_011579 [Polyplax serrata]|uniref:Ig-like domain-containing protein n=1 Tax=Polyplax serrata TaxID=468196 RepID=A0ABR1AQG2_POLSC
MAGLCMCKSERERCSTVDVKELKRSVTKVPPMLWIPHQLVGAPQGYSVSLECYTEAHPSSLNYWTREDGHMIHESKKYKAENTVGTPSYKTHMKLTITNVQDKDYGTYKCVAKNPRGETDGTIRLYSLPVSRKNVTFGYKSTDDVEPNVCSKIYEPNRAETGFTRLMSHTVESDKLIVEKEGKYGGGRPE